jgi:hypothetical protein
MSTVSIIGKTKTKYTFALPIKRGGFKIKTVLIFVYFIGNLSFNN